MIAMRDTPYYKVGLLTHGSCRLTQEGREALLRPGDLAIYDCRRPYTMAFAEAHQMSFLMFPCDRLRLPPAAVNQVLVSPVSSAESTGSLVAPFLRQLVANLEQSKSPVNCRLADNLLDLLATMFGERTAHRPPTPPAVQRSLLLGVQEWIDAHLSNTMSARSLSPARTTSPSGPPPSFSTRVTSVARWVRERTAAGRLPP